MLSVLVGILNACLFNVQKLVTYLEKSYTRNIDCSGLPGFGQKENQQKGSGMTTSKKYVVWLNMYGGQSEIYKKS